MKMNRDFTLVPKSLKELRLSTFLLQFPSQAGNCRFARAEILASRVKDSSLKLISPEWRQIHAEGVKFGLFHKRKRS
jgi:hypothetical protein